MKKIPVTFIGYQQRLRGLPIALVNDEEHNTVAYRPAKHRIINDMAYMEAFEQEIRKIAAGMHIPCIITKQKLQ